MDGRRNRDEHAGVLKSIAWVCLKRVVIIEFLIASLLITGVGIAVFLIGLVYADRVELALTHRRFLLLGLAAFVASLLIVVTLGY
jgi:hypothetical protein